ncbi:biotin carboxylase [Deinobacterium chartae]|uniref:Biotin carboxylase n=1 Tax=Deinobacterium chartae TaxID=521158 RepID=A0A841I1K8_9DEIO|nr:ATP-grasp domain-containing protein [Deinobacterium chartae]MBB6098310.1 biotin carboxylase [Deinobacterium chartae]
MTDSPTAPSTPAHVLLVGGMRVIQDLVRDQPGVRTTLIHRAHKIQDQDARRNLRLLGASSDDPAEWIALARAVHELDPFSAVGAFHEFEQDKAAHIARALGLPFHAPEVIERVRDKLRMRERLRDSGLDPTPSARVSSGAQLLDFARLHGYPLIVKPVDGWASTSILTVRSDAEAQQVSAQLEAQNLSSALVEPFLEGREFSVEALSERGEHRVVAITQKFKDPVTFVEIGHLVPAPLEARERHDLEVFVIRLLSALGVQDGVSHTEVMLTAQGPRAIETHTRPGGDFIPELVQEALGVDLFRLLARQTLGQRVLPELDAALRSAQQHYAAIWFVTPEQPGILEEVRGIEQAWSGEGVRAVELLLEPGAGVEPVRHSFHRGAYARATAPDPQQALERARDALKALEFRVIPPAQPERAQENVAAPA